MNDETRLTLEKLGVVFEQRMGTGAFAEVWRVKYRGMPRALRICLHPLDDSPKGQLSQRERDTLRKLVAHPQILNRIGFIDELPLRVTGDGGDAHYFVSVWQLAERDLAGWWQEAPPADRDARLLEYLRQVAGSIDLLNEHGFHHRDVKPENILVDGHSAWLCDLGFAAQVGLTTYIGTFVGTEKFWPPEMKDHGESHATNDLYGLAASYLMLKTRLAPARFLDMHEKHHLPPGLFAAEAAVLAHALARDPDQRPADGAVAWVRCLEQAAQPLPAQPKAGSTLKAKKTLAISDAEKEKLLQRLSKLAPAHLLDKVQLLIGMTFGEKPSLFLPLGARALATIEWVEANNKWDRLKQVLRELAGDDASDDDFDVQDGPL